MSSHNAVTLVGNLGQDPEYKTLPSGSRVCNFSMATTEHWKNKDGSVGFGNIQYPEKSDIDYINVNGTWYKVSK